MKVLFTDHRQIVLLRCNHFASSIGYLITELIKKYIFYSIKTLFCRKLID